MKVQAISIAVLTLALSGWAIGQDPSSPPDEGGPPAPVPCDLATVVRGFYCENDGKILESTEVVSDVTYYQCEQCLQVSAEPGKCADCEVELSTKTTEGEVCRFCMEPPIAVEVCTKSCFACPGCGSVTDGQSRCSECEGKPKRVKTESRALVQYRCTECGASSFVPGECQDDSCANHAKPLERTCMMSGTPPHVLPAGAPKQEAPRTETPAAPQGDEPDSEK